MSHFFNACAKFATLLLLVLAASCGQWTDGPSARERPGSLGEAFTGTTLTLTSGSQAQSGYDFVAQTYQGNSHGDFYFYQGSFFANNTGQRGLVDVGPQCPSLTLSAMPTSGFSMSVPAVVGDCYVSLTQGDERDYVVFEVSAASSSATTIVWDLLTTPDGGVTLTAGGLSGYEFSTKTYTGNSGGDFYFVGGAFFANNYDQHGVEALGPCAGVEVAGALPNAYTTTDHTAVVGNCYASMMRFDNRHRIVFRVDALTATTATLTWHLVPTPLNQLAWQHCDPYVVDNPPPEPAQNVLTNYLAAEPAIGAAMQWISPTVTTPATTVAYSAWPSAMQTQLATNFVAYWNWYNSGMVGTDPGAIDDPPPNQVATNANQLGAVLAPADAQTLYVKYVALSLVVELQHRVPWSLLSFDSASLAELLDSRKFFTAYTTAGYSLIQDSVIPAPPLVAAQIAAENHFACTNRPASIAEAVFWARNLQHFNNTNDWSQDELNFWQYGGTPPASRVLSGTQYSGTSANVMKGVTHWTFGCHGTTGLLKSLLRTVNIPVEHFGAENPSVSLPQNAYYTSGHAVPHFLADGLWLSHADDPYIGVGGSPIYNDILPYPLQAMLLSDAQFFGWFPNTGNTPGIPIGRQGDEIWVHYGAQSMLTRHLTDLLTNPTPPDTNLCGLITLNPPNNYYTCAQAEATGLLPLLDGLVQPYVPAGTLYPDLSNVPTYYNVDAPSGDMFSAMNGSFQSGLSTWNTTGTATADTSGCYGDSGCLQLGLPTPTNGDSTASQTFTVPSGMAGISVWYKESCPDSLQFDWATLTLTDLAPSGATTTLLPPQCATTGWTQVTGAVIAGHTYTLKLTSHDDNYTGDPTYTLFDDVTFMTSSTPTAGITNGGFTSALSGWPASGASVGIVPNAYSGGPALQAGSASPTNGDSSASQTFVVPAGNSKVSFWYQMTCPDTVDYDWATATLTDNTAGGVATLLAPTCTNAAWTQVSGAVIAGHSYTLSLVSHDDDYPADPSLTLFSNVTLN